MKSVSKNLQWFDKNGKMIFWVFAALLLFMTAWYVYLVNTAALNGVRWSRTEQDIASRGAAVSELESHYLALKQSVTLSLAYAKGFQDVKTVTFISPQKVGVVATANEI